MSRIVIDARELTTSSGRYVERLLNYLQLIDSDHDYQVLLKPKDIDSWVIKSPNFHAVACEFKEFTFGEQFGLKKQINGLKPDLVHFTFPQQPILYTGRVITTVHDLTTVRYINPDKNFLIYRIKQRVYRRVIKRAARKSLKLIVPSNYVKNDLAGFANILGSKILVTPEAADKINDPPVEVPDVRPKQFIMYIGRPTPHKNLERLIQSFVNLQKKHEDLQLILAGKSDANYLRLAKIVEGRGIKNILFTGFISEGQLRWLYENCLAYVFPSLSEGFGLPGLEAMIHGAPVASSNTTCLPEIYGDAALYFDPLDVVSITSALDKLLADAKLRKHLVDLGYVQAKKYSWQKMAEETLDTYNNCLKKA